MALGIPDPDSSWAGDVNVAGTIDFDAVGNAFTFSAGFFTEDAPVCQRSIGPEIVDADVALFAVVYIKLLSVGGEGQAIGLRKFLGEQSEFSGRVEAKYALKVQLLL